MRPAPSVVAAPPLAVHPLSGYPGRADIVRQNAVVPVLVRHPRVKIIQHPLPVFLLARIHIGAGDHTRGRQVQRHVSRNHPLVHQLEHAGEHLVVIPVHSHIGIGAVHAGHILVRRQIVRQHRAMGDPILGAHLKARPPAAVDGRPNHLVLGIPVGRLGVFADIHTRKPKRAPPVNVVLGIGHPEVIEVGITLPVMHPVVIRVELPVDLTVFGELPGNGVELPARQIVETLASAQNVEQREGQETLIRVIGTVHTRPFLPPHEGTVGPGVFPHKGRPESIHQIHQITLLHRPVRRGLTPGDLDNRGLCL